MSNCRKRFKLCMKTMEEKRIENRIAWCNYIGTQLIEDVTCSIGGQTLDRIHGEWSSIWTELHLKTTGYTIKKWWRGILAKRRLQRLRLVRELEYLPPQTIVTTFPGGLKYREAMERFDEFKKFL